MKKVIVFTLIFMIIFTYIPFDVNANSVSSAAAEQTSEPSISSEAAIVADADTGYIYYQKNMHKKMYPASITKVLTGIVAVENGSDSDTITVTKEALDGINSEVANIWLTEGEQITQEEALYTMFLASANDSANAIAIHNGGSISGFVDMMNSCAKELGAVDSHFSNANGLPDKNNVTSAYDMALITKKALSEPKLMKYFGAVTYEMPATNMRKDACVYNTLHMMMKNTAYKYDGVIAGKTGWETMSGHTLVTAAKRNGRTLICVALKCDTKRSIYKDTAALLDYCFELPQSEDGEYLENPAAAAVTSSLSSQTAAPVIAQQKQQKIKVTADSAKAKDNTTLPLITALIVFSAVFTLCARQSAKYEKSHQRYRYRGYTQRRRVQSRQK